MNKIIVAVKDLAAQTFGQPFFVRHANEGIRSFTDEVNRRPSQEQPNPLYDHPDDFELYAVGHYDDSTGQLSAPSAPQLLVQAKHVSKHGSSAPTPIQHVQMPVEGKSVLLTQ